MIPHIKPHYLSAFAWMLWLLCIATASIPTYADQIQHSPAIDTRFPAIVEKVEPHNSQIFTQGFFKDGNTFYESSGLYHRSFIQRDNGSATISANLPSRYFAEGLTVFKERLYLLTWKEETLFVFNKHTLALENQIHYNGQGWGLTHNDKQLIMSNGSSTLLFRNPKNFAIERRLTIQQALQLNELEYVEGVIWANDWNEDIIYGISEHHGCIVATMDLSHIRKLAVTPNRSNISNGIAYDKQAQGLWVTGKYWPFRYLIRYPEISKDKMQNSHC